MVVVGAFGDFGSAVDLFGDDYSSESMWKDEFGETPDKICFGANLVVEAVSTTNENNHLTAVYKGTLQSLGIFV